MSEPELPRRDEGRTVATSSPVDAGRPGEPGATSRLGGILDFVERVGNRLPHPATLFALLAAGVALASWLAEAVGLAASHPATGKAVVPVNLLSRDGLHLLLTGLVKNFTDFAPLGTVLVAMLGIGICEGSGLIGAGLRLLVSQAPRRLLTVVVVFAGVMSNAASEVGYVLLVPLAGMAFQAVGRHPVAGMAAAFAGVSAGYSANLLLGTVDPLLAGLTQEAARLVDGGYTVNAACNYFFMAVSTLILSVTGAWVTEAVVMPRLGEPAGNGVAGPGPVEPAVAARGAGVGVGVETSAGAGAPGMAPLAADERRGLWRVAAMLGLVTVVVLLGLVPADGFLRDPKTQSVLKSPFMDGIVAQLFLVTAAIGVVYGVTVGKFRSDADVMKAMGTVMSTMGGYLVLVFFAAQFVAFFKWSNLGLIVAVRGAAALQASGLGPVPLMVLFILLSAGINLFMGSASAKWAIMAPVFVPMFMLLGFTPELVQCAYRIGDSVTNVISPMMSYFALIIAFIEKYDRRAGIGTLIAMMLPYSVAFLAIWTLLLAVWMLLGLPVGPGAGLYLPRAGGG